MGTSRTKSNTRGTWRKRRSSTSDLVRFWEQELVHGAAVRDCSAECSHLHVVLTRWRCTKRIRRDNSRQVTVVSVEKKTRSYKASTGVCCDRFFLKETS